MVWPCPLPVDVYAAAGRGVGFPRPLDCLSCGGTMTFWSGYQRYVRVGGRSRKIFVPRLRCGRCGVSHALLPAFVLAWRLDVDGWFGDRAGGRRRVRCAPGRGPGGCPVYDRAGGCAGSPAGPWSSARGSRRWPSSWARSRSARLMGRAGSQWPASGRRFRRPPGWLAVGLWRFASAVSGGRLIAANKAHPT